MPLETRCAWCSRTLFDEPGAREHIVKCAQNPSAARIRELEAEVARLTKERDDFARGFDFEQERAERHLKEARALRARVEVLEKALRGADAEIATAASAMDGLVEFTPECACPAEGCAADAYAGVQSVVRSRMNRARAALKAEGAAGPKVEP